MTSLYFSPQIPDSNSLEDFEKLEWTLLEEYDISSDDRYVVFNKDE